MLCSNQHTGQLYKPLWNKLLFEWLKTMILIATLGSVEYLNMIKQATFELETIQILSTKATIPLVRD